MDISTHINTLIKFHECVVIPEFGGFISNYKSAKYDNQRNTFSPPSKEIVFNTKINKNDGLLINHLVDNERISYSEAHRVISNFVEQTWTRLYKGETIEMKNLGSFKLDRNGAVFFTATTSFELVEVYGLKEFNYQSTVFDNPIPTYQPRPAIRAIQHRGNTLKIAASISLLVALSFFPMKNNKLQLHTSTLNPITAFTESKPENTEIKEEVKTEVPATAAIEINKVAPYILIGGNFQLLENANLLSDELSKLGHKPEIIHLNNGNYRVAIDSYADYDTALKAMETYRLSHPGSMVWVSKR